MQLGRFDELGSGILNVNKYIKAYSGKDKPQFFKGATFKTFILVKDTFFGAVDGVPVAAFEGAIKGATEGTKIRLVESSLKRIPAPALNLLNYKRFLMYLKEQ